MIVPIVKKIFETTGTIGKIRTLIWKPGLSVSQCVARVGSKFLRSGGSGLASSPCALSFFANFVPRTEIPANQVILITRILIFRPQIHLDMTKTNETNYF